MYILLLCNRILNQLMKLTVSSARAYYQRAWPLSVRRWLFTLLQVKGCRFEETLQLLVHLQHLDLSSHSKCKCPYFLAGREEAAGNEQNVHQLPVSHQEWVAYVREGQWSRVCLTETPSSNSGRQQRRNQRLVLVLILRPHASPSIWLNDTTKIRKKAAEGTQRRRCKFGQFHLLRSLWSRKSAAEFLTTRLKMSLRALSATLEQFVWLLMKC